MNVITVSQAESNLQNVIDQIINDVEPTIITTNTGDSVVMLSLDEFNAWQETHYLLSTPANAEQLMQSIAEDKEDPAELSQTREDVVGESREKENGDEEQ